ncbi:hypothetical protein NFJ02_06g127540 [Pycnococcus provasolii]
MHALGDNSVPPREARRELDVIVASMRGLLAAERGAAMLLRKDEQGGGRAGGTHSHFAPEYPATTSCLCVGGRGGDTRRRTQRRA